MNLLLCDQCWELAYDPQSYDPMFPRAECTDECSLDLDHTGVCAARYSKRDQRESCTNCGKVDRLHELDSEDVTSEGAAALAEERRASVQAGVVERGLQDEPCIYAIGTPAQHVAGPGYHLVSAGDGGVCCDAHWDERLR